MAREHRSPDEEMLARGRAGAVLVAATVAAFVFLPVTAQAAGTPTWCASVALRIWPAAGYPGASMPLYLEVASAYPQEIIVRSIQGQFAGSSAVYSWGSVILGAYSGVNLSQVVTVPASGGFTITFTVVGRALNDTSDITCTWGVPFGQYGLPSTGFEGTTVAPEAFLFLGLAAVAVLLVLVWKRALSPLPPVGHPAPPLTRCPVCGAPLVPGTPSGFWRCARCGWQ